MSDQVYPDPITAYEALIGPSGPGVSLHDIRNEPSLVDISESWLQQHGIKPNDPAEAQDLICRVQDTIWKQFTISLCGELPEEKVDAFDQVWSAIPSVEVALAWLKIYFPGYDALAERAQAAITHEIEAATYKKQLVSSWAKLAWHKKPAFSGDLLSPTQLVKWGLIKNEQDSERKPLIEKIYKELERRVGLTIAAIMTDEQLYDFESTGKSDSSADDDDQKEKLLEDAVPYYKVIVSAEARKLGSDIQNSYHKLDLIENHQPDVSDQLHDFLENYVVDSSVEETADALHSPEVRRYYIDWLPYELLKAVNSKRITPRYMSEYLQLHFESQQDIDKWLRDRWTLWFDKPYPEIPTE